MPASTEISAFISLTNNEKKTVGRERIALLEAVGQHGSISAAAKAVGLSYKAAWDGLEAMQNLVSQPLLTRNTGGRHGGGAKLTSQGLKLIETFHHLEAGLAHMMNETQSSLDTLGLSATGFFQGFMMRTSARNVFAGTIEKIILQKPVAQVVIRIAKGLTLTAQITTGSLTTLGLIEGRQIAALIKAPFVKILNLKSEIAERLNTYHGKIHHMETGDTIIEVIVDLGQERTIIATIDKNTASRLTLGDDVTVAIHPNDIILATT